MTANTAFNEIQGVHSLLIKWSETNYDPILGTMACNMRNKFDKYWGKVENTNPLIYIGIVLDPRFKLEYVNFLCDENYEPAIATILKKKIVDTLHRLYFFYAQGVQEIPQSFDDVGVHERPSLSRKSSNDMGMLRAHTLKRVQQWKRLKMAQECPDKKTDLEKYLSHDTVDICENDFNILSWWKDNSAKYGVLSLMARDVLAIPISTVASESCFSTGGRVLDVFRSSLSPKMIEALICCQNWLNPNDVNVEEVFDEFQSTDSIIHGKFYVICITY